MRTADHHLPTAKAGCDPFARSSLKSLHLGQGETSFKCLFHHGPSERMLGIRFDRGREREQFRLRSDHRNDLAQAGVTLSKGSGLIENHGLARAHQHSSFRRFARPTYD